MNKEELISAVSVMMEVSKSKAAEAVTATFQSIKNTLAEGEEVKLIGFGTFSVSERKSINGRNPRTGEQITIPATRYVKFKVGKQLKESVASTT